jgi:hypothetical protein
MSAYQNFLDFFSMHNKERLDGLSESYFEPMTKDERARAFDYLYKLVEAGGTEESVHGLFRADRERAIEPVGGLLAKGVLRDDAAIAAATNLYKSAGDASLLATFIKNFANPKDELRGKAAYYAPADAPTPELLSALKGMVITETDRLAMIHATNKLLECYGVTRETVDKEEFSRLYKGLRSDDLRVKESTFKVLDTSYAVNVA